MKAPHPRVLATEAMDDLFTGSHEVVSLEAHLMQVRATYAVADALDDVADEVRKLRHTIAESRR